MTRFPSYSAVSKLLARSLGLEVSELESAFQRATKEDLLEILHLRGHHALTTPRKDDREYLEWRYDFSGGDGDSQLWVFRLDGLVVGLVGVERQVLSYQDKSWTTYRTMDILLHESQVGSGLGAWINLRLHELFENTICIGSTKYSHSIVTRLHTPLPDWQTWRYPIRLEEYRGLGLLLAPFNLLLRFRRMLKSRPVPKEYALDVRETVPTDILGLRESMAQYCLVPSRTLSRYGWRIEDHPFLHATHFGLRQDGVLLAHAVVCVGASGRADLYDLLFLHDGDEDRSIRILADLASMVIGHLAERKVNVVSTTVNDPLLTQALTLAGFVQRDEPCAMGYRFSDPDLAGALESGVPLYVLPMDADFDFPG